MSLPYVARDWVLIVVSALLAVACLWLTWRVPGSSWFGAVFFGFCFSVAVLLPFWERKQAQLFRERVIFDDQGVQRFQRGKVIESIRWEAVAEIRIDTTDAGPFDEDVFWFFVGKEKDSGVLIRAGADGVAELFEHLQRFPGFDHRQVAVAMGCVENARFTVWSADS